MKSFGLVFFLVCVVHIGNIENAKILSVLPLPTTSHFVMYRTLFEELALRGHDIDVATPLPPGRNISGLNYIALGESIPIQLPIQQVRHASTKGMLDFMFGIALEQNSTSVCQLIFKEDALKSIRNSKQKYDLLIMESFIPDCLFGYASVFKAPLVVLTSSVDLPWGSGRIGNPNNPSFIQNFYSKISPEMTFYERLQNTLIYVLTQLMFKKYQWKQQEDARTFFENDSINLDDIVGNASLFLVNSHFSLNEARPKVPNFIEVAGLHIGEPKPLQKNLQEFIGDSKFIYFSLGTVTQSETIPFQLLQGICDIFKELKHKVIWKVDATKFPKELIVPENVYTEKWLTQLDLLCHSNILLFITHNGLMGTQEAVYCGVPMLSIPLFADQYLNAKNMVYKGVALELDIDTASKDDIDTSIKELLKNPKYKNNAKRLSEQFTDRPRKPLDEAVYWIEYVLRHKGAPQLRSRSADLEWYKYYLVDVFLVLATLLILVLSVICAVKNYILKTLFVLQETKED